MDDQASKNEEQERPVGESFIFKLGLADALRLTMFGVLIAVANDVLRMPLHLPGHTSLWWFGILVLGRGLIPKFGAGTIIGAVSGTLASVLGLAEGGPHAFFIYFIPGLLLDFIAPLFFNKLENPFVGILCGALTSLTKMAINMVIGALLHLPMGFMAVGLGIASISHTVFGAIGGLIAAGLIKRLRPRLTNWND
jgi:ABC-type thiamin/hydroxymethylpyrimidine transport system permease subunit